MVADFPTSSLAFIQDHLELTGDTGEDSLGQFDGAVLGVIVHDDDFIFGSNPDATPLGVSSRKSPAL